LCLCYSQTLVLLESPSVTAWQAGHVPGARCAVLGVQWLSLSPGPWSGSWAEEQGTVWQPHCCTPLFSLLQISPHNVV